MPLYILFFYACLFELNLLFPPFRASPLTRTSFVATESMLPYEDLKHYPIEAIKPLLLVERW